MNVLAALVLGVATAGCGGGSGSKTGSGGSGGVGGMNGDAAVTGSCLSFTACGGNIVGTWHLAAGCGSITSASCAQGIAFEVGAVPATYTFGSNGTFMSAVSGTLSETFRYPLACLGGVSDGGLSEACAALQDSIRSALARVDGGSGLSDLSASCSVAANEICACNEAYTLTSQTQSGTYTTSGNQVNITITSSSNDAGVGDGGATPTEYCVSGNTLTLQATANGQVVARLTR